MWLNNIERSLLLLCYRATQCIRLAVLIAGTAFSSKGIGELAAAIVFAATLSVASETARGEEGRISVDGTGFVIALPEGVILRGGDVVGHTLTVSGTTMRILSMLQEIGSIGGDVYFYHIQFRHQDGTWAEACPRTDSEIELAFPLKEDKGISRIVCASSAEARCVVYGYRPWERRSGVPMLDLHRACVRVMRADYGGDGMLHAIDETILQLYDTYGIRKPTPAVGASFEAAWNASGALCVARVRAPEVFDLNELANKYSRLRNAVGPDRCSEGHELTQGRALMYSRILDR